jgi:hypothetical protein
VREKRLTVVTNRVRAACRAPQTPVRSEFVTQLEHRRSGSDRAVRASADHLRTIEAAELLGVTPETLRVWHQRFGFPSSCAVPGERRQFVIGEVIALRDALLNERSISVAVSKARANLAGVDLSAHPAITSARRYTS